MLCCVKGCVYEQYRDCNHNHCNNDIHGLKLLQSLDLLLDVFVQDVNAI